MTITIRPAEKQDAKLLLSLIRELAEYEKLSNDVVATEESLANTLFGAHPYAEALIAEADGEAAGFCLFFHNYSTFLGKPGIYIEDVFVRSSQRGKNIGSALFDKVKQLAAERGCGRVEWSVLDWNKPAIDFYINKGAKKLDEWSIFRLSETEFA